MSTDIAADLRAPISDADLVAMCDRRADAEVEANIAARTRGDDTAAELHMERGQQWLRVAEILRDLP
jgi:hypothetical protein